MPIVYFPYRWRSSYWLKNLSHAWYDIRGGIANIFRWTPVIWHDRHWDHDFLLQILQYKFTKMAESLGKGCLARRDRTAKQCRICAELCKRLNEDKYFENAGYSNIARYNKLPDYTRRQIALHAGKMQAQDQRYLGMMIGKYLVHWWD